MYVINTHCAFSVYNYRMFNKHRMHGMAIFKIFTGVEMKVDINVAEEFTSHFTESTLLYCNTEAFLPACILVQISSVRLIDKSRHNNISKNTHFAFSVYNYRMFNKHRMHGMVIFKIFTDVEMKVDINVAEEFTSHFTESTLLYCNTEAFLPTCILLQIRTFRQIN